MTEKIEFELLASEDAIVIIRKKTNKKMMAMLCDILNQTFMTQTGKWAFEAHNGEENLIISILMKSANEYDGWGANNIVIQNFDDIAVDDEMKNTLKKTLFRCVRMYADDHQCVPKRKNGYMEMLLRDIRKLISRK